MTVPVEQAIADAAAQRTGVSPAQVPLGVQLGLGPNWQPTPGGWRWQNLSGPNGKVHVLVLDTLAGSVGLAMSPEDLRRFVASATEQSSGLVVPEVQVR